MVTNTCVQKNTRKGMTMWAVIVLSGLVCCAVLGAPVSLCPKSCSCAATGIGLEARCKSFDFLSKPLSPEQIKSIVALDIGNNSITKLANLKSLSHLTRLNLSANKLQHITAAYLPKSLERLDLSHNSIRHLTQDLHLLPALKEINLFSNPISCNCESVSVRDVLVKKGILFTPPPKCETPKELRGKSWLWATCKRSGVENLFEDMQGDAPYEGSGSGEVTLTTESEPVENPEKYDSIEEEFIRVVPYSKLESAVSTEAPSTETPELEGSGDEPEVTTSDFSIISGNQETTTKADDDDYYDEYDDFYTEATTASEPPVVTADTSLLNQAPVKACNFNCSTPSPLGPSNETDTAPSPGLFEGFQIVANDLNIIGDTETTTATTTPTPTSEEPTTAVEIPVKIGVERGRAIDLDKTNITADAEIIGKDLNSNKESGNISNEPTKQSTSTFIFLSVLLLIIICLVIYAIVKKRAIRRNRRQSSSQEDEKEALPEEIEMLNKPASQTDKPNGTHEAVPLMNGHNENQNKNAEEILPSDVNNETKPHDEGDDVELRPKQTEQKILLTPETKRVTIKASEIPNSTPKTPILVTRHLNSDGSIVTTPNIDQHV